MIAAFSITPLGTGESVSELVADCVRIVRDSGLANETNSMFTNVEGPLGEVMDVIERCIAHVAAKASRVSVVVKMDVRADDNAGGKLASKVASVERHLAD